METGCARCGTVPSAREALREFGRSRQPTASRRCERRQSQIEWLAELRERYELVWASTWEEHANTYIAPLLGLPGLAVPVGSHGKLRTGVQIMAMRNREDLCLDAGEVIEAAEGVVTPIDPEPA